jgi:type IV pilus assembly protein PilA
MMKHFTESRQRRDQGFTLIELLTAIVIIGIISAVAIPVFLRQKEKALIAGMRADVRTVVGGMEAWRADNPGVTYPDIYHNHGAGGTTPGGLALLGVPKFSHSSTAMHTYDSSHISGSAPGTSYCIELENGRISGGTMSYESSKGGFLPFAATPRVYCYT